MSKQFPVLGVAVLAWCTIFSAFVGSSFKHRHQAVARSAGPEGSSYELWADFRQQRLKKPLQSWEVTREAESGQVTVAPSGKEGALQSVQVKEGLLNLARSLREKFQKIGVELPKGKLVSGIVVDKKFAKEVLEEVEDLQIPVYTARKEVEGEKAEGNNFFVCKATDGTPVACLATKIRLSSTLPHAAEDVFGFEDDKSKAENQKKEAEEMKRYREGLKDPEKYVLPPPSRMRELFGLPPEPRKPDPNRLLAKTLPPDALLWGRALMERKKSGRVGYKLQSTKAVEATEKMANVVDVDTQ